MKPLTYFAGVLGVFVLGVVLTDLHVFGVAPGFVLIASFVGVYLAPTAVAYLRQRANLVSIGVLNLFLGWTLVGWVVALVWAYSTVEARPRAPRAPGSPVPAAPTPVAADTKPCPYCAEPILRAAIRCKHCGSDLTAASPTA